MAELLERPTNLADVKPSETTEVGVDAFVAKERGKLDINFFASVLLPTVMLSELPPFYIATFKILVNRNPKDIGKILRFALGLPRGHAKTTFIKIIISWLIAYDVISFPVIVCATDDLAEALMADIAEALASDNMIAIFGRIDFTTDSKQEKQAYYHKRAIIMKARGAGSALRGINIKHKRPDLIFFDDAQTKECDESPVESKRFKSWLVRTFKIIAPAGNRLIIYVGNMYSEECVLYQLKLSKSWVSLITGAILEDGEPLWPELHSLESLYESYIHDESLGEADVWFAEVMNDPISRATSLLDGMLSSSLLTDESLPDGVFITIDPAGFRKVSDDNVIAVHYISDGKGHVRELETEIKDPEQLIIRALQLAVIHGASLIGVEDTAYQQTLLFWFNKYLKDFQINGIEIVPLKPKNRTKESRIRLFIAELYAKNYFLFDVVRTLFVFQAMKYKLGKLDNKDDILDCCSYGLDVRNEYWYLITNKRTEGRFQLTDAVVVGNNTPF